MIKIFILLTLILSLKTWGATDAPLIITTSSSLMEKINKSNPRIKTIGLYENTSILEVPENTLASISELAHQEGKCGGFFVHSSVGEARSAIANTFSKSTNKNYTVKDLELIKTLVQKVKEENIRGTIVELSSFNNRYYQSETGVSAANKIKEIWSKYADTELYNHKSWKQPSVIATIKGSKNPEEVIVIGGHLDSISGFFGGANAKAPGADDNASGIATTTEVLRIISESGYKPFKTIKFMGYAAEEVGLRGSDEIARDYKERGVPVVGVLQLDMTNYKGSDKTIYLTKDFTNEAQTTFLSKLVETYVKVPYGYTTCGYACSDHASWHRQGYPAVFPFEADKPGMNSKIHTANDTIAVSDNNANHAVNFAKLGLAYLMELDLQGFDVGSKRIDLRL